MKPGKYELARETLDKTTQCADNFSCLKGDGNCLCEIEQVINHNLLFIKPSDKTLCNYRNSFGFSAYYCSCPARLQIFRLYNM